MPFVNSMGGKSNYTYIEMRPRNYYTYVYTERQDALTQREVYGDAWLLHVPFDPAKTLEENRLDESYGFEKHFIRGLQKMKLRCALALMVMLAMAMGRIREKQGINMRSLLKAL